MIKGDLVFHEARGWVGVPYVHQGRSRYGVDCIGFVICVRNAISPMPSWMQTSRNYGRVSQQDLLLQGLQRECTRIEAPEEGCIVLIQWPMNKIPQHVAIHGRGNIIHAYARSQKVIETGYRAHWLRDTHSLWRMPGVAPP